MKLNFIFLLLFCLWVSPVSAADKDFGRITRPMTAIDAVTLQSDGTRVVLWGVKPAPVSAVPFQLSALLFLGGEAAGGEINCKIVSGFAPEVTARCMSRNNADLGLALLHRGYVIVDRRQAAGSAFAADYMRAEETARAHGKGVWRLAAGEEKDAFLPAWLQPYMPLLTPAALVAGPLSAVLLSLFVMSLWLRKITAAQRNEFDRFRRKENELLSRERHVLIAMLEGELVENRNKIEAFLSVYRAMLQDLQSGQGTPKYQYAGDVVQKNPFLNKIVFRANAGKLALLDVKLAGQLSRLYASLPEGQEYARLDPDMPLTEAASEVRSVLESAESFLSPIDDVLKILNSKS